MNRTFILSALALVACDGGPDPRVAQLTERVDQLEERVETVEKQRPAARPQPKRPDPSVTYYLPVDEHDAIRGAADAKVTIVEAYEYACPYCALVEPILSQLIDKYEGQDSLRVVSKQFVVHPQLATAAALATCAAAKQDRFEPFSDALWATAWSTTGGRPQMKREELGKDAIIEVAKKSGLDTKRFAADLDGAECKQRLERDRQNLARIGVRGTPMLYVNGRPYVGPRTVEGLAKAVDAELAKFEEARGASGAVAGWYDELMKKARRTL
ncbi:MAG: DsbA family protein [Deltaproteobacteria bacterium]|jgi:protein-disulfide isomerase